MIITPKEKQKIGDSYYVKQKKKKKMGMFVVTAHIIQKDIEFLKFRKSCAFHMFYSKRKGSSKFFYSIANKRVEIKAFAS